MKLFRRESEIIFKMKAAAILAIVVVIAVFYLNTEQEFMSDEEKQFQGNELNLLVFRVYQSIQKRL